MRSQRDAQASYANVPSNEKTQTAPFSSHLSVFFFPPRDGCISHVAENASQAPQGICNISRLGQHSAAVYLLVGRLLV